MSKRKRTQTNASKAETNKQTGNPNQGTNQEICTFDVWMAVIQSEQGSRIQRGFRPVIIVSNNKANEHSPVVTVVPVTSKNKAKIPTHVILRGDGFIKTSLALCEQVMPLDKVNLKRKVGAIRRPFVRESIHRALKIQLGIF